MEKLKHDRVSTEMRRRLIANREGKLHPSQWLDLATEPLVMLLLLAAPTAVILGPRLAVVFRAWWLFLLVFVIVAIVPTLLRARRYARTPVFFARLYGTGGFQRRWLFWRLPKFRSADDVTVRFSRQLAPQLPTEPGQEYLVYYLDEPAGKVLLSFAPADHQDAETWLPTPRFETRQARRRGSAPLPVKDRLR
ncbi:MAG: hypothetical protein JNL42_07075 [Anaerolineae bacterium]|nr:hypothetical protein [Anaerolineae bacterium]